MSQPAHNQIKIPGNLDRQAAGLVRDTIDWLTSNSLDIAIAVGVAVALAAILFGLRTLGCRLIERSKGGDLPWRLTFARVIARTGTFFIVMASAEFVADHAATPPSLLGVIHVLFVIAFAFQAALWARELVLGYVEHRVGTDDEHSSLGSAIGIIRLLVSIALFAIALIVILDNLGINVTGLVAGLGIGGIAIGLAAQSVFADLFAALAILFDRPFRRGDTITFGTMTATVMQIGLKTTRLKSLTGEEVVMSNAKLLDQQIQNWALLERRRGVMNFGVTYQTDADLIARIPLELKEIVEAQPLGTFDRCHAFQFAASSIDFEFIFHVESADMTDFMTVRQAIMIAMVRKFAELGISFAYPTQTSFTAAPDGTMILPYPEAMSAKKS
jgi:small-conductance mechanosensitive channel